MTENFKRFLAALVCYLLIPFTSYMPVRPADYIERFALATIVFVLMARVVWRGSWTEKITCGLFGVPALWYMAREIIQLLHGGNPFGADK